MPGPSRRELRVPTVVPCECVAQRRSIVRLSVRAAKPVFGSDPRRRVREGAAVERTFHHNPTPESSAGVHDALEHVGAARRDTNGHGRSCASVKEHLRTARAGSRMISRGDTWPGGSCRRFGAVGRVATNTGVAHTPAGLGVGVFFGVARHGLGTAMGSGETRRGCGL